MQKNNKKKKTFSTVFKKKTSYDIDSWEIKVVRCYNIILKSVENKNIPHYKIDSRGNDFVTLN